MSTGESKYFHFPAEPELHRLVKQRAGRAHMSMAAWLHALVENEVADEEKLIELLGGLEDKIDRILTLLEG